MNEPNSLRSGVATEALIITEQLRRAVPGGIGTYVRGLLQGLAAVGEQRICAHTFSGTADHRVTAKLWEHRLVTFPTDIEGHRLDIAHATSFTFPSPRSRFRDSRLPFAMFVHDVAWRTAPEAFPARGIAWHDRSLARAFRDVDAFIVPSNLTADALLAAGLKHQSVHVVPEGADHLSLGTRADPLGGGCLLSVCTLEPRKNLRRVLEAYAHIRPRLREPWPLKVVGPEGWGDHRPDEIPPGVEFLGRVDDHVLASLYAEARAFVYVPITEGFGLPPLEAMRAGLPVLSVRAVPSVGDAALVVDPTDVAAIAEGMALVLDDDAVRTELIERGRSHAAAFTWRHTAEQHLDVWNSMIDRHG